MRVEVYSVSYDKKSKEVVIEVTDVSEVNLIRIERYRDDLEPELLEFRCRLDTAMGAHYLNRWFNSQKAYVDLKVSLAGQRPTWTQTSHALSGTVTEINTRYFKRAA